MSTRKILEYIQSQQDSMVDLIRTLVEIESPTHHKAGVDSVADAIVKAAEGIAKVTRYPQQEYGDHLRLEFDIPTQGDGQILGLGHLDTVYELGTLKHMPWAQEKGRLWGPGVFDMKAGVVYLLYAAKALRELNLQSRCRFVVQLNSDEEIGSPTSTPFTEQEAKRSSVVLVAEPSFGVEGNLKTARKGGCSYRIEVEGKASHSGLDFAAGANAIVELAEQITRVADLTDLESGKTVNVGVIRGGTATNVVPEHAWVDVDVRFSDRQQAEELMCRIETLKPLNPRCSIRVIEGRKKMPLERTPQVVELFNLARKISSDMGMGLAEASVGGCSDGNTTAALGIPTLDGIGAVGEGAHSRNESILEKRIADRAALITAMVQRL